MTSRWTMARRVVQLLIIALIASPLAGLTIFQGNLASGDLFGLTLSDPLAFLQVVIGGQVLVTSYLISMLLVLGFYFLAGGRSFCGWVCPVNLLAELNDKVRSRLKTGEANLPLSWNHWSLALVVVVVVVSGAPLFEMISPIGVIGRALVFASLMPLLLIIAIMLVELLVARRIWCRSLCPLGGFYSLLGYYSPLRVGFVANNCTHCNECLAVCPVEEVLEPSLADNVPQVASGHCTRCMACVDSCPTKALKVDIGYK